MDLFAISGGGSVFDRQLRDVKNAQQRLKRMETSG